MNIDEIPTPETDAEWNSPDVCTQFPELAYAMREKSKDLERRLTIARESLKKLDNRLMRDAQRKQIIEETLALTAPKP